MLREEAWTEPESNPEDASSAEDPEAVPAAAGEQLELDLGGTEESREP
ncbi:MAG: hypothetical protein IKD50_08270 [Clostridia bacterium]|nr:hypothetical protein [Clostridia bacterium]